MSNELELYKIARNSIEHFDKLLSNFRTIVLGFNGTIIATVMAFYGRAIVKSTSPATDKTQVKLLFIGSAIFAFTNILIWYLEKHYHRYLTVSSKVAEKLEKDLFSDQKIRLTYQLRKVRNFEFFDETIPQKIRKRISKISQYIRTYDCLYLFPIIVSIALNIDLANSLRQFDSWIMAKAIFLISAIATYILIRRSYWVTKYYNLASNAVSDQQKNTVKIELRNRRTWFFIGLARVKEFAGLLLIVSMFLPIFNNRFMLLIPLALGIFIYVCGRGILLQENWARNSWRWPAVIFAFIILYTMKRYYVPIEVLLLTSLLIGLCVWDFCYLSCHAIKSIFKP